jgi:hypothetical protein
MLTLDSLTDSPTQFNAITGLNQQEFMILLYHFAPVVEEYYRYHDLKGQTRKSECYTERGDNSLPGSANKLLFMLSYMKENPNQAYHGALFGMSQGKVSLWVRQLSALLEDALRRMKKLPQRTANQLYYLLNSFLEMALLMDVAERRIGRSVDYQVQKEHYSRKKSTHTLKNLVVTTLTQEVLYLGETFEGRVHDKTMYDRAELTFPEQDHCLWADLGFLGIEAENTAVILPEKKPKGQELTNYQKELNGLIASIRVTVEHAIAGIKRVKIIRNQIRLHGWQVRDRMMAIACGLHNIRCQRWAA